MNDKFDEMTKSLAQCVTRRQALKRFGVGFAGAVLACLGLANATRAHAQGTHTCCVYEGGHGVCVHPGTKLQSVGRGQHPSWSQTSSQARQRDSGAGLHVLHLVGRQNTLPAC